MNDNNNKNYEKIFVTKTGFGLKKKYYPDAIKKIKELAKKEKGNKSKLK